MAYKDKDKQREADKERQRRYRDKAKGVTKGVTSEGVTEGVTQGVTVKDITLERAVGVYAIPNYGQPDCQCKHCQQTRNNKSNLILNHGPHKTAGELGPNELNRVSLPGDPDYDGVGLRRAADNGSERPQDGRQGLQEAGH